jgi:hypothetical protein
MTNIFLISLFFVAIIVTSLVISNLDLGLKVPAYVFVSNTSRYKNQSRFSSLQGKAGRVLRPSIEHTLVDTRQEADKEGQYSLNKNQLLEWENYLL